MIKFSYLKNNKKENIEQIAKKIAREKPPFSIINYMSHMKNFKSLSNYKSLLNNIKYLDL